MGNQTEMNPAIPMKCPAAHFSRWFIVKSIPSRTHVHAKRKRIDRMESNCNESTETNLNDEHPMPSEGKILKRRRAPRAERKRERFAIAPSHLIGDGSGHRVGPQAGPYKRGRQDIRGASVLKSRNSSDHEGILGE